MQSAIPPNAEHTPMMASSLVLFELEDADDVEELLSACPVDPPSELIGSGIDVTANVASMWFASWLGIPLVSVYIPDCRALTS